jgi:biopolymer transport protein ExbD
MEGYNVDIPRSSADAVPAQSAELQLVLGIAPASCSILEPPAGNGVPADCKVTLADQQIPAADLPDRVAQILGGEPPEKRVLFLAADDRLNYEGVLRIIDLAKSGVEDLKIEFVATN